MFCAMLVILAVGLVFTVLGPLSYWKRKKFEAKGEMVEAEIVDLVKRTLSGNSPAVRYEVYYPVVSYQTLDGQPICKKLTPGSNPSPYSKGQKITIMYDPEGPDCCIIPNKLERITIPAIFTGVGLICLTISVIWFLQTL